MKLKLFGLVWDIKPVFAFLWLMVVAGIVIAMIKSMMDDNIVLVFVFFTLGMLWTYITNTLVENGILE